MNNQVKTFFFAGQSFNLVVLKDDIFIGFMQDNLNAFIIAPELTFHKIFCPYCMRWYDYFESR